MGKHKPLSLDTHKYRTTFTSTTKIVLRFSTPAPWAAWNHQIYAAGGVGGSTTMVVVFDVCLCVVVDGLVMSRARQMSKGTRE